MSGINGRNQCVRLAPAVPKLWSCSGYGPHPPGYDSDFVVARYLPGDPDIEITGFAVNESDSTLLDVSYYIWNSQPDPFDIGIYASFEGQTPDTLLIDHYTVSGTGDLELQPEDHTVSIDAVFRDQGGSVYDLEQDYWLMAKVDSNDAVAEEDESNNAMVFEGGIFRDPVSDVVHVHGTDTPNQDPELDEKDILEIWVDATETYFQLWLNADTQGDPTAQFAKTDVSEFHIRTHDGIDWVLTPQPENIFQVSGIDVPIWAFGGLGNDAILGGDEPDKLYGGWGNDELLGRMGNDTIYGEEDDDGLEGWAGDDTIYGGPGDDRLEGWSGADHLYGEAGNDVIIGGPDDKPGGDDVGDWIYGGPGDDRIDGWRGDDIIYGDRHPDDELYGEGDGNDEIYGFDGNDEIHGAGGHDNLFGEAGQDELHGDDGLDFLDGGEDVDLIIDGGQDLDSPEIDDFGTRFHEDAYGEYYDYHRFLDEQNPWEHEMTEVDDVQAEVFTRWVPEADPDGYQWAQWVAYDIYSGSVFKGTRTVDQSWAWQMDETLHDYKWASLGTYTFDSGPLNLKVYCSDPEKAVCVDAFMAVPDWPELNLVAQVGRDVFVDDRGPGWQGTETYQGTGEPPAGTPGYWFTQPTPQPPYAFGNSQSFLYAHDLVEGDDQPPPDPPPDPLGDDFGDGENEATWYLPVWTQKANVYVTWVARPDGASNATFTVTYTGKDAPPLDPNPEQFNQQYPPRADLMIGDRPYAYLGRFDNKEGWLYVHLSDYGVPVGECIIADAVLLRPWVDPSDPGAEDRPGSWANREENGFYQGVLIDLADPEQPYAIIKVDVNDPREELSEKKLQLNFAGDGEVIEIYADEDMTERINSGDTWTIGETDFPFFIYVKGLEAGGTELVLTLEDPITGRPLSDILVINVTG